MSETGRNGVVLLSVLLTSAKLFAAPVPFSIEIDRITSGTVSLEKIALDSDPDSVSSPQVAVEILRISNEGSEIRPGPFRLLCPGSLGTVISGTCANGEWTVRVLEDFPDLSGTISAISLQGEKTILSTLGQFGEIAWQARLEMAEGGFTVDVEVPEQPIGNLRFLLADVPQFGWVSNGQFSASADVSAAGGDETWIRADTRFSGIDFDSPDGSYAGLGVDVNLSLGIGDLENEPLGLNGQLISGELLLMDFYRDFSLGALDFAAFVDFPDSGVEIPRFVVSDGSALSAAGEVRWPVNPGSEGDSGDIELILREFSLEFPLAYSRYLEPVMTVYSLDGMDTKGSVSWTGDWSPGSGRSGTLRINELSINDSKRSRFGINNLSGELSTFSQSTFTWDALSFEKIDLGSGAAKLALTPETVKLTEPLTIGVFGGKFNLEEFSLTIPRAAEPDVQLRASIDSIEMLQMTRAMGWPEFGGTLSGVIPGINWSDGVIEVEGALDFEIFDGALVLTDLRVERPFGVLPSLAANISATRLDLEELTQTFEFGRIAGRADGYVRNLRMLDWQPVQFDAWFGTPVSDDGKHDISRQAVSHLTTLGGGSATTLLTGPVLRLFNNFSYRRLGFGCELKNNICRIRGVDEQDDGVVLMEGAGIPKISILAYNRSVDWPQLLAELTALTGGESIRVGD